MSEKFNDIKGFHGQQNDYKGQLLGVCIKCNSTPKMQKNRTWASFRVCCSRCDVKTLDYGNMGLAAKAWNDKVKRPLGE